MVKDGEHLERFEADMAGRSEMSLEQKLRLLEAMYEHARKLGVFPPADPLEGIEVDVRVARIARHV